MQTIAVTSVSSRGQVVIPDKIRKRLGITAGAKLAVVTDGQNVLMKLIRAPTVGDFTALLGATRKAAREAGLKPDDAKTAIGEVRRARRP